MKKWIHIPTFLFHGLLILIAAVTVHHYSDFFLVCSLIMMVLSCFFCGKSIKNGTSARSICISNLLGALVQAAVFTNGLIDVTSGAFGLGGGEFALLIYGAALIIFCIVIVLIALICSPK